SQEEWRRMALSLKLMRGFELTSDGRQVPIPRSAQRLIAFLALNERPVLRSHAAATLWLDSSEARCAGGLRTTLWRLPGPGHRLVQLHGERMAIAGQVAVDVHRLETVTRGLARDDGPLEADVLDELVGGGELLPGWYDDWVMMERERVRQLWLRALEAAAAQ